MRPLFFTDQIVHEVQLLGESGHHAANVVRLRVGEEIDVSDGKRFVHARVTAVSHGRVLAEIMQELEIPTLVPQITVAQALIKGDAMAESIDVMTQVGVHRIWPWSAERSIVSWNADKAVKNQAKLQSVALEASKQSRRPQVPVVDGLISTETLLSRRGEFERVVLLHESGTEHLADDSFEEDSLLLIVGPEGGLSDAELQGFQGEIRRLGPTVIRSAQAGAIAAAVVFATTSWKKR